MKYDQRTKDYVARRTTEGLGKKEIMRYLKRYVARQIFPVLAQTLRLNEPGMTRNVSIGVSLAILNLAKRKAAAGAP